MKNYYIVIAVVLLVFSGGFYFYDIGASDNIGVKAFANREKLKKEETIIQTVTESTVKIVVYVTGEVKHIGLYEMDEGSRLYDVVKSAGGFTDDADRESINLARFVFDGEQIDIPKQGDEVVKGNSKVSINSGDVKSLCSLRGIGEGRANDIIKYREKNGPFKRLEDIMKVKGIKKNLFNKIKDDITL